MTECPGRLRHQATWTLAVTSKDGRMWRGASWPKPPGEAVCTVDRGCEECLELSSSGRVEEENERGQDFVIRPPCPDGIIRHLTRLHLGAGDPAMRHRITVLPGIGVSTNRQRMAGNFPASVHAQIWTLLAAKELPQCCLHLPEGNRLRGLSVAPQSGCLTCTPRAKQTPSALFPWGPQG